MTITILGKRWNLVYKPVAGDVDGGYCDPPTRPKKQIVVDSRLVGVEKLRVELHEMLHAADWYKDEEWVDETSADIAGVLWKLGYRTEE